MRDWRRSPKVAVGAVVLVGIIQLAVPLSRLGEHDRAQRFGWQMFSTAEPPPEFIVVTESDEVEIVLTDYMAVARADIDIVGLLPEHLCATVPDAVRVTWQSGEFTC